MFKKVPNTYITHDNFSMRCDCTKFIIDTAILNIPFNSDLYNITLQINSNILRYFSVNNLIKIALTTFTADSTKKFLERIIQEEVFYTCNNLIIEVHDSKSEIYKITNSKQLEDFIKKY